MVRIIISAVVGDKQICRTSEDLVVTWIGNAVDVCVVDIIIIFPVAIWLPLFSHYVPEERHQQASPLASESRDLLALTALVARQSRGTAIETGADPQLAPFVAKGRDLYMQRQGQLNLACTNCHDDNWDKRLAGAAITQGHPNGYPLYRLEWQSLGSLQRRLRACLTGIRAQPYDYGAPEMVDLELYLMSRARGMLIEAPAVRP